MEAIPILTTKFYVPPPHPVGAVRTRLFEQLDAGLRLGHRLLLICAPAGFGKTTLLSEWLTDFRLPIADFGSEISTDSTAPKSKIENPKSCWISLDEGDNDPTRFLLYLLAALETVHPDIGADARAMIQPPQSPPLTAILTVLLNRLAATLSEENLVLALDDYHVIEQPAIHDMVAFLLDHIPPRMHLAIATRVDPPLLLARLRARRQLTELRAAELRFTADETATFLNHIMGLNLTPENIAALAARTEGWIASLQLAAISLQHRDAAGAADFIAAFSGSHRHVIDYLTEEVLAQQSPEIHEFLSQTAILDRLTAPLCNAVTGRDDGEHLLRQLEQANLFLAPLDDERQWYRYHRLFADFMRNHIYNEAPDLMRTLHSRAAAWYAEHAMPSEAITHALRAADFKAAAQWIEHIAVTLLMRSEATTLLNWIKALPQPVIDTRPTLNLIYAEAALIAGEFTHIETALHTVEIALNRGDVPAEEQAAIQSQVIAVRAYMATFSGNIRHGVALAQQAFTALPQGNAFLRSVVSWLLGLSQFFDTDTLAAQRVFGETLELSQATGNTLIASLSLFVSGYFFTLQGRLRQARITFEQGVASLIGDQRTPPPVSASLVYQGLAEVLREMNDLEAAAQVITRCIDLGEQWGNAEVLVDSYVVLTRIVYAQGDETRARQTLGKVMTYVHEDKISRLTVRQMEAFQARMQVAWGELDAATLWVEKWHNAYAQEPLPEGNIAVFIRWMEVSALARFYLTRGHYTAALETLTPLRHLVEDAGWMGVAIELLGLESLALHGLGQREAAHDTLQRALTLAAPEGYVRVFVEMGAGMTDLLREVLEKGIMPDYVQSLLQVTGYQFPVTDSQSLIPTSSMHTPNSQLLTLNSQLLEPLSDRELEILRLIDTGATNREIAAKLYIAISTVKTHINNLYGKLSVSNRVQALARARELGLLA
jgi:LuxR family maltose regulon positive regulatory protein